MYLTHKQKKRRKRIKYSGLLLGIVFLIWFSFGLYLNLTNGDKKKLENIGYSNIEISIIKDILNTKEIKTLYNYEYITSLTDVLLNKEFNQNNLSNYLNYYSKYNDIKTNELIYIINNEFDNLEYNDFNRKIIFHKYFEKDKIDRYYTYYNKYKLDIDDTIYAVNNNFDIYNIKYDEKYTEFINEDYAIYSRLDRYYKYKTYNKHKTTSQVISEVNSNLDLKEYEYKNKANIDKGIYILVNKYYYLDSDYEPNNLVSIDKKLGRGKMNEEAYNSYKEMYEDATLDNVYLYINKAYTSYKEQNKLYRSNKSYHEKAGFSEAQTGLCIDVSYNKWLDENAYKYGFILRYPKGKEYITGYFKNNYYRYVGVEIANFIHNNDITYEEYYAYFIEQN